ncbi:hypothetical protein MLD38_034372 [Melastoma candidum]|uniref:Uncharacterized protein n=1 Tax=Melastoma candidum TaxID=119954 RepID=A0ACB9MB34_9MYRT|nr:hypothetical protein MLD38_034372 [Melastoma candidum]
MSITLRSEIDFVVVANGRPLEYHVLTLVQQWLLVRSILTRMWMDSGLEDDSLLTLQGRHHSSCIWDGDGGEDVALLYGLSVDGRVVTGVTTGHGWDVKCVRLLGHVPPNNAFRGSRLKLSWLKTTFDSLPLDATDEAVRFHVRAYMFLPLLDDLEGIRGYSCGSACLDWLYHALAAIELSHPEYARIPWEYHDTGRRTEDEDEEMELLLRIMLDPHSMRHYRWIYTVMHKKMYTIVPF